MRSMRLLAVLLAFMFTASSRPAAQLTAAKDGPVAYGHHHLNVTNLEQHRKFWVDTLGGTAIKVGSGDVIKFPNVLVFLRVQPPTGGTKGTTVNHVGFSVPSARAAVDKAKAAGYPIVTRAEVPPAQDVKDDLAFIANQNNNVAFVMGPDDIKVELVENKTQTAPIALHHIHFFVNADHKAMRDWYVKTFDAKPGMRGSFDAADLPGVNLTYSLSADPVTGTRGRTLDHIGFEVKGLEAFCKKLEAAGVKFDRPYSKVEALKISLAFFTDPFGTYIELTEGLDQF